MDISYEKLANNIVEENAEGGTMHVVFKCPLTDKSFEASAQMRAASGVGARVKQRAKREFLYQAKMSIVRGLRGLFGGGKVGRVASSMGSAGMKSGSSGASYGKAEKQAGVVAAFKSISGKFVWNDEKSAFVSAADLEGLLSAYDIQLSKGPVESKWDRGVLARMLAEIVASDGTVADEERSFFEAFLTDEIGSLDDLLKRDPLSQTEIDETSATARETMLMLAWSVALCDEELDDAESKKLGSFAGMLGVNDGRAGELRAAASDKVIENVLDECYADGEFDNDERKRVNDLAQGIGVNGDRVAKIDVRLRKRRGIV